MALAAAWEHWGRVESIPETCRKWAVTLESFSCCFWASSAVMSMWSGEAAEAQLDLWEKSQVYAGFDFLHRMLSLGLILSNLDAQAPLAMCVLVAPCPCAVGRKEVLSGETSSADENQSEVRPPSEGHSSSHSYKEGGESVNRSVTGSQLVFQALRLAFEHVKHLWKQHCTTFEGSRIYVEIMVTLIKHTLQLLKCGCLHALVCKTFCHLTLLLWSNSIFLRGKVKKHF